MATGSRTLKLSILADVDNLKKGLTQASDDTDSFGKKLGDFGAKAGAAFALAGAAALAYAGKALVEATKNAIADEEAQKNLALTLQNTTKATDAQIKSVESYITQVSLSKGITDDELRPAFERLTRSTKSTEESQKLLNIALDVSTATGKPLETVANALGKAYDGNSAALGKLGLGLDADILKSKDMNKITKALAENFGGFASQRAETFSGKMDRLKIAFDEGKETIGSFVLDGITPLVTLIIDGVSLAISGVVSGINLAISAINLLIKGYNAVNNLFGGKDLKEIPAVILAKGTQAPTVTAVDAAKVKAEITKEIAVVAKEIAKETATVAKEVAKTTVAATTQTVADNLKTELGGTTGNIGEAMFAIRQAESGFIAPVAAISTAVGEAMFAIRQAESGFIPPVAPTSTAVGEAMFRIRQMESGNVPPTTINVNVSGAIDQEGTARTIVNTLNNSFYRGTNGARALVL